MDYLEADCLRQPGQAMGASGISISSIVDLVVEPLRPHPQQFDLLNVLNSCTNSLHEAFLFAQRREGKGVFTVEKLTAQCIPNFGYQ